MSDGDMLVEVELTDQMTVYDTKRIVIRLRDLAYDYSEEYVIIPRVDGGIEIYPGTHEGMCFIVGELKENGVLVHVTGEAQK